MALDPAFLDELRARTPIAAVIGRKARLVRSGRQLKGCCPFHGEKTPSFYVYEDHFHCFGCGAHGDAISFVMQAEGRSFIEAVEALAGEAGLEVPRQAPVDRERAEQARGLSELLQAAQASYAHRLHRPEGRDGLAYLRGRGLSDETIATHGLGWSGDGRGGLVAELEAQGFDRDALAASGLMRLDESGRPKGELFFNRVTFPIRDRRGALVSFGGRTLGDGQPKYLNGPETALFVKRRTLFGLDRAQAWLRGAGQGMASPGNQAAASRALLVVEGYMDVIVLHQAGFGGAVAPLGTALTAEQLEALWRASPAPVLCFDGDKAGRNAARRAAETALPLLDPERTLRFVRLPEGEDPDSLVRGRGAPAMQAQIDGAQPLADMLFGLLTEGMRDPGPEQRAALLDRLMQAAATIGHRELATQYRESFRRSFRDAFSWRRPGQAGRASRGAPGSAPGSAGGRSGWPGGRPGGAYRGAPAPALPPRQAPHAGQARLERLRLLVAILLRHPDLLQDVEQAFCQLELPDRLARLRAAMLDWTGISGQPGSDQDRNEVASASLDSARLIAHLHTAGLSAELDAVLGSSLLPVTALATAESMPAEAEAAWWQFFGLVNAAGLREQVASAQRLLAERWDPAVQRQLILLTSALSAVERGEQAGDEDG